VRQGSVPSPCLSTYVNCRYDVVLHPYEQVVSILYADDMILPCPSVTGLQQMLDKCVLTGKKLSLFTVLINYFHGVGQIRTPNMR
jgi:hypothetical protein